MKFAFIAQQVALRSTRCAEFSGPPGAATTPGKPSEASGEGVRNGSHARPVLVASASHGQCADASGCPIYRTLPIRLRQLRDGCVGFRATRRAPPSQDIRGH